MAKISFNEMNNYANRSQKYENRVGFFSLREDGEEAIVRFMHDDVESFDILSVHDVKVSGKTRKVNCLRTPSSPIDQCPLCKAGTPTRERIFIHLIQYVQDENGKIVGVPKVWERSLDYAHKLKNYMDNFAPLSGVMCKIIRHGAPGDQKTYYEIIPNLSKEKYPDTKYPVDHEAFKDFTVLGGIVMDKDAASINSFLATGSFPSKSNSNQYNRGNGNYGAPAAPAPTYAPTTPTQASYDSVESVDFPDSFAPFNTGNDNSWY